MDEIVRLDHRVIFSIVEPKSKVLDLGCGDGDLLNYLVKEKKVKAQGIELSENAIYKCVEKGLHVYQSDIDSGLVGYPDNAFDYVILNQSLQEAKKILTVLDDALRVGKKVIVGFPNFAYISARIRLFFKGKAPITKSLPYYWYTTPNLRFLSITDFRDYCNKKKISIVSRFYLGTRREVRFLPNVFSLNAVFVITR